MNETWPATRSRITHSLLHTLRVRQESSIDEGSSLHSTSLIESTFRKKIKLFWRSIKSTGIWVSGNRRFATYHASPRSRSGNTRDGRYPPSLNSVFLRTSSSLPGILQRMIIEMVKNPGLSVWIWKSPDLEPKYRAICYWNEWGIRICLLQTAQSSFETPIPSRRSSHQHRLHWVYHQERTI